MGCCRTTTAVITVLIAVAIALLRSKNISGGPFNDVPTADLSVDMSGKTVVISGGNTGIGFETSRAMHAMGARLIMACRRPSKCQEAADLITAAHAVPVPGAPEAPRGGSVEVMELDLSSLASVDAFVRSFEALGTPLHVLINNAAVFLMDGDPGTADGYGLMPFVNHFGVFALTNKLLPSLKAAGAGARIVTVASNAHRQGEIDVATFEKQGATGFVDYGSSKLANMLMTTSLARRLEGSGITTTSLHPGFIKTDLAREVDAKWWGKLAMGLTGVVAMEPWQGAQTTIWAATSPEAAALNGDYLEHCAPAPVSHPQLADTAVAEALWARSLVVTGLAPWETIDDL